MKHLFHKLIWCIFPIIFLNVLAFNTEPQLYVAKNKTLAIYDVYTQKKLIAIFPSNTQFFSYPGTRNPEGWKFLTAREFNISGYAKQSDIVQIALPTDSYERFQLLLDDYNKLQNIEFGGTFANISNRNIDHSILELYVHRIFLITDETTKKQYAKDMYKIWSDCNPNEQHLTIKFIIRSIAGSDKTVFQITDGIAHSAD